MQLAHREVALAQRGPEVPVQQGAQVVHVLHRQRLVESVEALEVGPHRGAQRLLLVERAAGRQAHDGERKGDDDEQRDSDGGDAPQRVAQHARL